MEPSPAESLHITSFTSPHRNKPVGGGHTPITTSHSRSPTLSEDSGYGKENSPASSYNQGKYSYHPERCPNVWSGEHYRKPIVSYCPTAEMK